MFNRADDTCNLPGIDYLGFITHWAALQLILCELCIGAPAITQVIKQYTKESALLREKFET